MNKPKASPADTTTLSRTWVWLILVIILLPTILAVVGTHVGTVSSASATDWGMSSPADRAGPTMYTISQVAGFSVAFLAAILCFIHFSHTGEVTTSILGAGLICVAVVDIWQTLAANFLIPVQTAADLFIPLSWTLSRGLYALTIITAVSVFLISGHVKAERRRRRSLMMVGCVTALFIGISVSMIYFLGTRPELCESFYGTGQAQMWWNITPLVLFLVAGLYVLPTYYMWHRTIFAQTLILGSIALALGQAHFAFGTAAPFDWHFLTANVLKVLGYMIPMIGLVLDYERTYAQLKTSNRQLQDKLLLFEQSQGVSRQKQQVLETLLETLPAPVCLLDSSLRITMVNAAQARIGGLNHPFEAIGKAPEQVPGGPADGEGRTYCLQVLETGDAAVGSAQVVEGPDGQQQEMAWTYTPIRGEDGQVMAVMCLGRDRLPEAG